MHHDIIILNIFTIFMINSRIIFINTIITQIINIIFFTTIIIAKVIVIAVVAFIFEIFFIPFFMNILRKEIIYFLEIAHRCIIVVFIS